MLELGLGLEIRVNGLGFRVRVLSLGFRYGVRVRIRI